MLQTKKGRKEASETLERYIDGTSIEDVLMILQDICSAKAKHLKTKWKDEVQASLWVGVRRRLQNAVKYARDTGL